MKVIFKQIEQWVQLSVKGEVDRFTYPIFAKELNVLQRIGRKFIILDLEQVAYLNVQAIRLIAGAIQSVSRRNGKIVLVGAGDDILELVGLVSGHDVKHVKALKDMDMSIHE